jgi:hypothetical protein
MNGRGKHMAIVSIGQSKQVNEMVITADKSVVDVMLHQPTCTIELSSGQVGSIA